MSRGSSCKLELQFATFISGSRRMPHFAEDMEQIQRRRFLWLSVAFGAVAAAACGSESSDVTPAPEAMTGDPLPIKAVVLDTVYSDIVEYRPVILFANGTYTRDANAAMYGNVRPQGQGLLATSARTKTGD